MELGGHRCPTRASEQTQARITSQKANPTTDSCLANAHSVSAYRNGRVHATHPTVPSGCYWSTLGPGRVFPRLRATPTYDLAALSMHGAACVLVSTLQRFLFPHPVWISGAVGSRGLHRSPAATEHLLVLRCFRNFKSLAHLWSCAS